MAAKGVQSAAVGADTFICVDFVFGPRVEQATQLTFAFGLTREAGVAFCNCSWDPPRLARRATTTALTHPTDSSNPHRFSYAMAPEPGAGGRTCRARKGGGLYLTSGPRPSAQTLPEDPKTQALP